MTVPAPSRLADSGPDRWSSSSGSSNTSRRASSPDDQITVAGSDAPQLATQAGDEFAPGAVISRYMVLSRLGSGAMGVVYAAYDPELDRKVALKLLHPRSGSSLDSKVRLMREAKALARLSHPNVVAVHDVGTFADRVFLAMEFIDGKTLGAWLKEKAQPRPWREVLAILGKAGEGLAAAHAAGLIHRDFKPDNVLIARDGRVRVLDFGLARSAADASPEDTEVDPAAAAVLASVSSERRERSQTEAALLTRTGALVGTPAYMSPEQHLGRFADPRSDQFSFCVALYQALYGVRPFGGERMTSLAFQVLQGKVGAAPPGTTVPAWLRRIVLRGLNVDPELRYPGMPELLADLDRHSGGGKRRRGLLLASAALVGLGLWLGLRATANTPTPCQGAPLHLRGTWDPERSAALGEVFRTSKLPYAAATWASVRPSLDLYALRWTHAFTDACEDTHVRGEQSGQLLDLRMACLERRRIELHELTEVLQAGDTAAIEKASEGVSGLGDLAACADVTALTALVEPPPGTLKEDVERVTAGIARASALELAARWTEAAELTAAAIADPATAAYPPLLAAALRVHARVQRRLGATAEAAESLRSATQAAARGRDDRAAAEAWIDLVFLAGAYLNQAELTHAYTLAATATVLRSGADPLLRAHLDANTFVAQIRLGDPDLAAGDRALAYFEANPDADPNEHHRVLNSLGIVRMHRGEKQGARDLFERALKLGRQHFGADHPPTRSSSPTSPSSPSPRSTRKRPAATPTRAPRSAASSPRTTSTTPTPRRSTPRSPRPATRPPSPPTTTAAPSLSTRPARIRRPPRSAPCTTTWRSSPSPRTAPRRDPRVPQRPRGLPPGLARQRVHPHRRGEPRPEPAHRRRPRRRPQPARPRHPPAPGPQRPTTPRHRRRTRGPGPDPPRARRARRGPRAPRRRPPRPRAGRTRLPPPARPRPLHPRPLPRRAPPRSTATAAPARARRRRPRRRPRPRQPARPRRAASPGPEHPPTRAPLGARAAPRASLRPAQQLSPFSPAPAPDNVAPPRPRPLTHRN
ncbi:MAG: protein kinase [Nannocystis sp.]|nr:protein kinase [Nannocystis sp.]